MSDAKESCESCHFWDNWGEGFGKCCRYPPRVFAWVEPNRSIKQEMNKEFEEKTIWPETHKNDFCGEYKRFVPEEFPRLVK